MEKLQETGYLVVSARSIRVGTVARESGGMVLFRFAEGGGIRVPASRVYASEQAAQAAVKQVPVQTKPQERPTGRYEGNLYVPEPEKLTCPWIRIRGAASRR